jgi:YidC/Oxa1 family membrane protein insertase
MAAIDPSSVLHHFLLSADETAFTTADAAAKAIAESPAAAADGGNGWFGFLTLPIEYLLQAIHGALATSAVSSNAWGVSIIVMTVMIKAATYPLTRSQLESTNKMQVSVYDMINDLVYCFWGRVCRRLIYKYTHILF